MTRPVVLACLALALSAVSAQALTGVDLPVLTWPVDSPELPTQACTLAPAAPATACPTP